MATLKSPHSRRRVGVHRARKSGRGFEERYNQNAISAADPLQIAQRVIIGSIVRCGERPTGTAIALICGAKQSADGRGYRLALAALVAVHPVTDEVSLFSEGEIDRPRSGNSTVNSPISGRKAQTW